MTAPNRKLPSDRIIKSDFASGMSFAAMGRKYGTSAKAVIYHLERLGVRKVETPAMGQPEAIERRSMPVAGPDKIVVTKRVTGAGMAHGDTREIRISLPRLPSIHGHFEEVTA
jgi:hypothetical protein